VSEKERLAKRAVIDADLKAQMQVSRAMTKVIAEKHGAAERVVIARAAALGIFDGKSKQTVAQAEAAYVEGRPSGGLSDRLLKWIFVGVMVTLIVGGVSLCQSTATEGERACEALGGRTSLNGDECIF
jgi:hypothetical protein